jgi:hypothetical protein
MLDSNGTDTSEEEVGSNCDKPYFPLPFALFFIGYLIILTVDRVILRGHSHDHGEDGHEHGHGEDHEHENHDIEHCLEQKVQDSSFLNKNKKQGNHDSNQFHNMLENDGDHLHHCHNSHKRDD